MILLSFPQYDGIYEALPNYDDYPVDDVLEARLEGDLAAQRIGDEEEDDISFDVEPFNELLMGHQFLIRNPFMTPSLSSYLIRVLMVLLGTTHKETIIILLIMIDFCW